MQAGDAEPKAWEQKAASVSGSSLGSQSALLQTSHSLCVSECGQTAAPGRKALTKPVCNTGTGRGGV